MNKFELVFIPGPGISHLASTVEMANVLVSRDVRLSVTVLVIKLPNNIKTTEHIQSLSASFDGKSISFIVLPELPFPNQNGKPSLMMKAFLESHNPLVREVVTKLTNFPHSNCLVGFVIDMFCTTMIDVANEFGVPCYLFYTSSAGFLSLSFHLQELYNQNNGTVEQLQNSDVELALPSFISPVPTKAIPPFFFDKDIAAWFHDIAKRFRSEVKGILINTFEEMERQMIKWMSNGSLKIPKVYTVGPILQLKSIGGAQCNKTLNGADVLKWLDDQPLALVLFLCFGSRGSFDKDQVLEIAQALERSQVRFLWSLRQPPPKGKFEEPSDYANIKDVLPEGFLNRTTNIGRVIGWAPQVEILAHPATGGFISHCGWNSTLESVWHGVPIATWPMYAEQLFNAFEMVVELGLAVELTLDYKKDFQIERSRVVSAEEIESGIRKLMGDDSNEIRKKVEAKSKESRKSMKVGGSSFNSLGHFIDDALANSEEGNY